MPSIPTDELMTLIVRTVEDYLRRSKGGDAPTGKWNGRPVRSHWAITNSVLNTASNGVTTPSSVSVEILRKNSDGDLERTGVVKSITHRYEGISLEPGTLIRIKKADGEWMLEAADCEPLAEPPV